MPAPPPEFHLETWLGSLEKLQSLPCERLHLTHFGGGFAASEHFTQLRKRLVECVEFVAARAAETPPQLAEAYQKWDREQAAGYGVDSTAYQAYEKANPSFMSALGIARYLAKYRGSAGA